MSKTIKITKTIHLIILEEGEEKTKVCPECGGTEWLETYKGFRCVKCDYREYSLFEKFLRWLLGE